MTFDTNKESSLFHLKHKKEIIDDSSIDIEFLIKLRKTEVEIDGEKRTVVMI
jgi:hypothetical protein